MEGIAASHLPSFAIKPVARYLGIGIRHANISSYWRGASMMRMAHTYLAQF